MQPFRPAHPFSNYVVLTTLVALLGACAEPTATKESQVPIEVPRNIGMLPPTVPVFDGTASQNYDLGAVSSRGGNAMPTASTYAILWGPDWGVNPSFTTDKISTIESFFQGLNGSNFSKVLSQYPGANGAFGAAPYLGTVYETSSPPSSDPGYTYWASPLCSKIISHGLQLRSDIVYMVFAQTSPSTALGYHYFSNCSGVIIHWGVVLNTDLLPSIWVSDAGYHSDSAATLVDVASHEFSETVTDPEVNTWKTAMGAEIADKCARSYNGRILLANGASFKIQGEWSNADYYAHTGFANGRGELGCALSVPLAVFISGPNTLTRYQSAQYTATPQNGSGPFTYQWRNRSGPNSFSFGAWSPYSSPSSLNYSYFSVNSCGIGAAQLDVLITDPNGKTAETAYPIGISNPC